MRERKDDEEERERERAGEWKDGQSCCVLLASVTLHYTLPSHNVRESNQLSAHQPADIGCLCVFVCVCLHIIMLVL